MSYYKKHIFICTNQKGDGKECCANRNSLEMVAYAKEKLTKLGITKASKIRISSSGCMGRCSQGPVVAVYPEGNWYRYENKADLDQILNAGINNQVCPNLLLKDDK